MHTVLYSPLGGGRKKERKSLLTFCEGLYLERFFHSTLNGGGLAHLKPQVPTHLDVPVIASAGDACGDVEDYFAGGVGVVWRCVPCRLVLLQPTQKALVSLQVHLMAQRLVQGGVDTVGIFHICLAWSTSQWKGQHSVMM